MIIRSQDKKELHNFDRIANVCVLPCYRDEHKFIIEVNKQKTIGTYSTEEKAIKVLDMIKDAYCKMMFWNTATSGCSEKVGNCKEDIALKYIGQCSSNYCFQMPQDSEV